MSTAHKVIKNTGFIIIGNIFVKIIAIFISVYLARYLGVTDFGRYTFVTTYLMFFTFIVGFGLDPVIIREIAKDPLATSNIVNNALSIRIITSAIAIFLAIIGICFLGYPYDTILYVSIASIILLFQGICYLVEAIFQLNLKMEYAAITAIISKCFFALLVFYIILIHGSLMYIFIAFVISELLRALIGYIYCRRFVNIKIDINESTLKYLLKESLPFVIGYALFIIYYRVDILMLSISKGDTAVGIYSAAYKITDPLLFLPGALASTLMPVMSKQYVSEKEKLKYTYHKSIKYILVLMLPAVLGIYLLSENIINVVYGSEFSDSTITLQILSGTVIFNSLNSLQSSLLTSTNGQKFNTLAIGISCVLNICLNYILIPNYSYIGAAFSTLVCVVVLFLVEFYFVHKQLDINYINKDLIKPFIASGAMGIVLVKLSALNLIALIIVGMITYIISILLIKGFSKDDLHIVSSIIRRQ